jgi:hypothetical protein
MSTPYEVPLIPSQPQKLTISLAGVFYQLTVKWCQPAAAWILDIADALGNALVRGIPLITGTDLLAPYAYLGIGGHLVVQTDHDTLAVPTFDNLGDTGHLYFVTVP